jgi:hypothetical protein
MHRFADSGGKDIPFATRPAELFPTRMDVYQTGLTGSQAYVHGEVFVIPKCRRLEGFAQGATKLFHPTLLGSFVQAPGSVYFNVALGLVKPRKAGRAKSWCWKNQRLSSKFPKQRVSRELGLTRLWRVRQLQTRETEFAILNDKTSHFSTDAHYIDNAHPLRSHQVAQEVTANLSRRCKGLWRIRTAWPNETDFAARLMTSRKSQGESRMTNSWRVAGAARRNRNHR